MSVHCSQPPRPWYSVTGPTETDHSRHPEEDESRPGQASPRDPLESRQRRVCLPLCSFDRKENNTKAHTETRRTNTHTDQHCKGSEPLRGTTSCVVFHTHQLKEAAVLGTHAYNEGRNTCVHGLCRSPALDEHTEGVRIRGSGQTLKQPHNVMNWGTLRLQRIAVAIETTHCEMGIVRGLRNVSLSRKHRKALEGLFPQKIKLIIHCLYQRGVWFQHKH